MLNSNQSAFIISILPNLTLIDLPGISYESEEFEKDILELYAKYTKNPLAIILIILSATEDLTNSKANLSAKKNDPDRNRTMGVITKIDNPCDHIIK